VELSLVMKPAAPGKLARQRRRGFGFVAAMCGCVMSHEIRLPA